MKTTTKTHSSHRDGKIALRIDALAGIETPVILDAFSADGDLWRTITASIERPSKVVRIEKEKGRRGFYLQGDNLKWMRGMDLSVFDIIDLDAYGNCYWQIEELKRQGYCGTVICTWIVSIMSPTLMEVMRVIGMGPEMLKAAPTLCAELSPEAVFAYIEKTGVNQIKQVRQSEGDQKKRGFQRLYFSFKMNTL